MENEHIMDNDEKRGRGRPKNDHRVRSVRCSDAEYLYLKECLKRYRDQKLSEADRIKKMEAAGQKTLKF